MAEIAILTRVGGGRSAALREYLRTLPRPGAGEPHADSAVGRGRQPSPFDGLGTHFARFVVIDIGQPHLLFTTCFDGNEGKYLTAVANVPQAVGIWSHCELPRAVDASTLRHYLLSGKDRVQASYVIALLDPTTTVPQINRALKLRARISDFASSWQDADAVTLAHSFRQLEEIRELAGA
jgi:hypothetical protein